MTEIHSNFSQTNGANFVPDAGIQTRNALFTAISRGFVALGTFNRSAI